MANQRRCFGRVNVMIIVDVKSCNSKYINTPINDIFSLGISFVMPNIVIKTLESFTFIRLRDYFAYCCKFEAS